MRRTSVVLVGLAMMATACSFGESGTCRGAVGEPETHRYAETAADAELQSLDVYRSDGAGCPALIWVHGGSWQSGDKRTRLTAQVKAEHYVGDGFVFVSVNYRLASTENDTRWPDFGDDVAAAVAWVLDNADDIGVDPGSVSLVGHSSGAHLASIVGTNPDLMDRAGRGRDELACVISLDSVTHDLTDPPPWEVDIIDLAFPDPEALADGSPTLQAIEHGDEPALPAFQVVTRGRIERLDSARRLVGELVAAGGRAEVLDVSPYDHAEAGRLLGVEGEDRLTPAVDRFLATCSLGEHGA